LKYSLAFNVSLLATYIKRLWAAKTERPNGGIVVLKAALQIMNVDNSTNCELIHCSERVTITQGEKPELFKRKVV